MLSAQLPAILVILATVLMAVVIFAPVRAPAPVSVSFAPPFAVAGPYDVLDAADEVLGHIGDAAPGARWLEGIDARASACDVPARLALVDALAAVRGEWARAVLEHVVHDDPDPGVRAAAAAACAGLV